MIEVGGNSNFVLWEIFGEGYMKEGRIFEVLFCFEEVVFMDDVKNWKLKFSNVFVFIELCEKEVDIVSKEKFVGLMR